VFEAIEKFEKISDYLSPYINFDNGIKSFLLQILEKLAEIYIYLSDY